MGPLICNPPEARQNNEEALTKFGNKMATKIYLKNLEVSKKSRITTTEKAKNN